MSKATRVVVDGVNYPLDDTTAVDFSEAQSLSTAEKQQARTNIGAGNAADVTTIQALIGNTALPTTAQTITGAIAEHETDISDIKSTIGTVPSGSNLQGEVDDLKSALNESNLNSRACLIDAMENYLLDFFQAETVTGTKSKSYDVTDIPAGIYTLKIDSVVSSDTDAEKNLVRFVYNDNTYKYDMFNRGTNISIQTSFTKTVVGITFFASSSEAYSAGDTFTLSGVRLYEVSQLKGRLEGIDADIVDTNGIITSYNDQIYINNIITGKYISKASGYEGAAITDSNSECTDFVYVRKNTKVHISGCLITSNRSICGYDLNQNYKCVLSDGLSGTEVTITIPEDVVFIRITGANNGTISAYYVGAVEKYEDQAAFTGITITNGKMITSDPSYAGRAINQNSSACTEFIRVIPGSVILVNKIYIGSARSICCYDQNKTFVSVLATNQSTWTKVSIGIPVNARYIRITSHTDEAPELAYLSHVHSITMSPQYQASASLFDNATTVPVLTFIDDDTYGTSYVTRQKGLCDTLGIKCSFACLTSRIEEDSDLLQTLLGFERDGFPIIYHGYTQGNFYNTPTLDVAEEEDDFVHGIHQMLQHGFADWKIWCTPFGSSRDDQKKLAIKWGFDGLIKSGGNAINNPYAMTPKSLWEIERISLGSNSDTTASDLSNSITRIKAAIDAAKECNGWVCVSTHSAYVVYRTGEADAAMAEVVNYAISNGFEIRTVNEQLRRWMPVYRYYEQF